MTKSAIVAGIFISLQIAVFIANMKTKIAQEFAMKILDASPKAREKLEHFISRLYEILLKLGTESADDYIEYASIAFEERRKFSASQRYCIDFANSYFYICGSVGQTQTVYLYYIYETPEITLTSSPVWPTKFQRLIPYLMSEIWKAGVDADVLNLQQALALSKPGQILYQAMRNWDSSLKLKSMNHSTPMGLRGGVRTSGIVPDSDLL